MNEWMNSTAADIGESDAQNTAVSKYLMSCSKGPGHIA
jgi:hypothetical protein